METCYQDWPLAVWVALVPRGEIAYVDEKLFGYRLHNNNYSGSTQTLEKLRRNLRKSLDTIRLIEEMMTEKGGVSEGTRSNAQGKDDLRVTPSSGRRASGEPTAGVFVQLSGHKARPQRAEDFVESGACPTSWPPYGLWHC